MKKTGIILLLFISIWGHGVVYGQHMAIKSNLLYLTTTTPNMGFEFRLGKKMSFDLWGAYNAWEFKNDMSLKHYLVQPELRYWPCQTYEGHFFGLHGHFGHFNIGNIPFLPGLEEKNYRGELYGGGLTWGYHWMIGRHWGGGGSVRRRRLCTDAIREICLLRLYQGAQHLPPALFRPNPCGCFPNLFYPLTGTANETFLIHIII